MARALLELGRVDEAWSAATKADSLFRHALPDDHPDVARSESIMGQIKVAQGRPRDGERLLRHALTIRLAKFSSSSPHIADVERALGRLLAGEGRVAEAEQQLRSAAARYGRTLPSTDPRLRQTEQWLADLRVQRGQR